MPNLIKNINEENPPNGKLRIFFRGLCVFYIDKPKNQQKETTKQATKQASVPIKVLLPDARIPENTISCYEYDVNDPLFPHIPLLSIPKELLNPLPQLKPHKFIIEDEFVFPLTKHIIDVGQTDSQLKKTKDFENFIPNLREYVKDEKGNPININPDLLDPTKIRNHNKLSALLEIKTGTISIPSSQNTDPRRAADFIKTVFDTDNTSAPDEKAQLLANCVCWDIDIKYASKPKLSEKLSENSLINLITPLIEKNRFQSKVTSIAETLANKYSAKQSLEEPDKSLYKQLDEKYLKVDPTDFQQIFQQIFKQIAKELQDKNEVKYQDEYQDIVELVAQHIAAKLNPDHRYYPFTIKLKKPLDLNAELTLELQLKVKIDKDTNTIVGAVPGNIFITNMPLEGISMHLPFQRERDLDFALTYSVLERPVSTPYLLPRRIPSPDELNNQEQTMPPLMCAIVRYENAFANIEDPSNEFADKAD